MRQSKSICAGVLCALILTTQAGCEGGNSSEEDPKSQSNPTLSAATQEEELESVPIVWSSAVSDIGFSNVTGLVHFDGSWIMSFLSGGIHRISKDGALWEPMRILTLTSSRMVSGSSVLRLGTPGSGGTRSVYAMTTNGTRARLDEGESEWTALGNPTEVLATDMTFSRLSPDQETIYLAIKVGDPARGKMHRWKTSQAASELPTPAVFEGVLVVTRTIVNDDGSQESVDQLVAMSKGHVYRSVDGRIREWVLLEDAGIPEGTTIIRLVADPENGDHLYAGTEDRGLWESFDFGETWSLITSESGLHSDLSIYEILFVEDMIFVATSSGVFRNRDEWTQYGLSQETVRALACSKDEAGRTITLGAVVETKGVPEQNSFLIHELDSTSR